MRKCDTARFNLLLLSGVLAFVAFIVSEQVTRADVSHPITLQDCKQELLSPIQAREKLRLIPEVGMYHLLRNKKLALEARLFQIRSAFQHPEQPIPTKWRFSEVVFELSSLEQELVVSRQALQKEIRKIRRKIGETADKMEEIRTHFLDSFFHTHPGESDPFLEYDSLSQQIDESARDALHVSR